ncbi:RNA-guided pseudouridylation complex pseudouridine synthase subunit Cbf5 [Candidatus Pacearchaeota archaeon]|nr:RNA-guided pseudouridylation complex pseudouridine synthase subunit Cbf5 [Candidatus Pacearchaeota archaeon]
MNINLEKIKSSKSTEELLKFSIINIDKPLGSTSFQVSQFVKNLLGVNKTSHLGTLDPTIVSGVLPIALGRACRLSEYLMHRDKTYVGIMRLHREIKKEDLEKVIKEFIGKIKQLPPKRSRVKRAIREREVKSFKILEIDGKDILFETEVQAGTYIRKICDDIGKIIGGAHMLELRRTKAGFFTEDKIYTLYQLDKAVEDYKKRSDFALRDMLVPGEVISQILPVININKQVLKKCLAGSPIFLNFILKEEEIKNLEKDEKITVFCEESFVGCYKFIGSSSIIAVPEFVYN